MNKTQFTKREWVAMNRVGTGIYKIVSDTLQEVCETQMPYDAGLSRQEVFEQAKANARLIAAAPEMYAELEWLYEKHGYESTKKLLDRITPPVSEGSNGGAPSESKNDTL